MGITIRPRGTRFICDVLSRRLPCFPGGDGASYILDDIAGAVSAWSVQLLTSAYSGPLFRIKRSSDSAELDIYPTGTGDADTDAMTTFIGSDDAYIVTEYDQVDANDVNATGNIRVASAGTLYLRNGVLAPFFDGAAQLGKTAPASLPVGNAKRTVVSVAKFNVAPDEDYLVGWGTATGTGAKTALGGWVSTKLLANFGGGLVACAGVDTLAMRRHLYSWDQVTHKLYINGTNQALTDNTAPAINTLNNVLTIGNHLSGAFYVNGIISETIIFSDALSTADIATLDATQSSYFGS